MRLLLSNFMANGNAPADINDMDLHLSTSSARYKFDEFTGLTSSDLTRDEIDTLRPQVYERMAIEARSEKKYLFLKAHDAYYQNKAGQYLFPKSVCQKSIYIIRNPLDVAVSYAFHRGDSDFDSIISHMSNRMAYMAGEGYIQLHQRLLDWSGHVESWASQDDLTLKFVRYEDLLADTFTVFSDILKFLDLEYADDEYRVKKAINFSTFDTLKNAEAKDGFGETGLKTKRFFRSGSAGDWKNHLSNAQVDSLIKSHKLVMQKFGYSIEPNGRL